MREEDDMVVGVQELSVVRNRFDAAKGDPSKSGGGDGHGDSGGDGLNIQES